MKRSLLVVLAASFVAFAACEREEAAEEEMPAEETVPEAAPAPAPAPMDTMPMDTMM
ncbi:MAG: FAA hydrolase family protein, partial [Gemmatimonadetes bacterium]|nr:FAA hydrolase family protein [Gemmatimonadota bacterium]